MIDHDDDDDDDKSSDNNVNNEQTKTIATTPTTLSPSDEEARTTTRDECGEQSTTNHVTVMNNNHDDEPLPLRTSSSSSSSAIVHNRNHDPEQQQQSSLVTIHEFSSEEMREQQRIATREAMKNLEPPYSSYEKFRDWILRRLDNPVIQISGLVVLFLVVVDGAFFFFLLVGWHGMCEPRLDCQPRNWWYNFAVQMLVALFTYMNLVSIPWRASQLVHIYGWSCPRRCNDIGKDLYGFESHDLWYTIPLRPRGGITLCLFMSSITQFFNQAYRIVYYSYDLQNTYPGNIWVNVFFVASMATAAAGGFWLIGEEKKIRKAHPPDKFPPGLIEVIESSLRYWCCKKKDEPTTAVAAASTTRISYDDDDIIEPDPTRDQSFINITHATREEMRLFGM
jgi:Protein of unknown function (DUF2985)